MKVKDILKNKGRDVMSITSGAGLIEAMMKMSEQKVGSLIVKDGDSISGIITERDLLRCYQSPGEINNKKVSDYMTPSGKLIIAAPGDNVQYVMAMMTEHRIKHIPVMEEGHLAGMISIGDAVKAMLDQSVQETRRLQDYITGAYPEE
ncbi:CBS domain-containing protein [bacterium]|nr:CBS domain-containing protein [bacterium]